MSRLTGSDVKALKLSRSSALVVSCSSEAALRPMEQSHISSGLSWRHLMAEQERNFELLVRRGLLDLV
ncbi:hypothetical protein TNIN_324641 [Trichonephila inaurata madagascariensis]|uniref:Uncharacterized protein n=1 Tax=Trichonephila inaurata madagascariensis TaxID=2747483 RepID=A0A8X6XQ33_9ARAC|nr:hypothetical protein TNIN_324641 [Trichonephila inaurata madagascariensis]